MKNEKATATTTATLSHKIGEVKTYYNKYSDIGHTKLYRIDHEEGFEVKVSKTEGFPNAPTLKNGILEQPLELNILLIVFYVMVDGKLVFNHGVLKSTNLDGTKNQGKVETEQKVQNIIRLAELDCYDTITITDEINNYDLLTAN